MMPNRFLVSYLFHYDVFVSTFWIDMFPLDFYDFLEQLDDEYE